MHRICISTLQWHMGEKQGSNVQIGDTVSLIDKILQIVQGQAGHGTKITMYLALKIFF